MPACSLPWLKLGGFIPLNPLLRTRSIGQVVQDADPVMLVTENLIELGLVTRLPEPEVYILSEGVEGSTAFPAEGIAGIARPRQNATEQVSSAGTNSASTLEDLVKYGSLDADPGVSVIPEDLLALLYTSGTTGVPKGTMHSHRSLIAPVAASLIVRDLWLKRPNLKSIGQTAKALARYKTRLLRVAGKPQVFLSTVGWHAITGIEVMLQALLMGDTIVVMPHFHPRLAMELVQKEKVTILVAIPTAYLAILSLEDFDKFDTSSLLIAVQVPCPARLIWGERYKNASVAHCTSALAQPK